MGRERRGGDRSWLERAAYGVGRVGHALAEGAGLRLGYTGKELSVVSAQVAMLAEFDAALENPSELIATHGMAMIDKMRMDDTIHGIERGLIKTVLKRPGRYVPAADDAEDTRKHAAELNWNISNMEGSLKKSLEEIALAYCYGFTPTERVFDSGPTPFGLAIYLKALKTRKPHDFNIHVDKHGNIKPKGLYQIINGREVGYDLTVGDGGGFILYVYDEEFDNWLGNTAFGPAYRSYFCKEWFIKFQSIGIERFANGIPEIKIDLSETKGDYAAAQKKAEAILKSLQTESYIVMPSGFIFDIHELQGQGLQYIKDAILLHSGMIATALLAPEQAGFTQVEGGSYAKAESQIQNQWMSVVEEMREDLSEDVLGDQLGRVIIDLNHGPQEMYPVFEYDELSEDDKFEWLRAVVEAIKAGVIKNWTLEREEYVCKKFDLPMLPEDQRKILVAAESVAVAGGGGFGTPKGGGGGGGGAAPTEAEREEAGTPEATKQLAEPFPAHVFQMAEGPTPQRRQADIGRSATAALAEVVKGIRDDQIGRCEKLLALPKGKAHGQLKYWKLKGTGEIRRIIHATLLLATLSGKEAVRLQLKAKGIKPRDVHKLAGISDIALIPAIARKYFAGIPLSGEEAAIWSGRAFEVSDVASRTILKEVKQVLYDGLKHNDPRKTRMELRRIFQGYLDTGELSEGKLLQPWRIDTIVRNNVRDAYAQGRLSQLQDPDVDAVVVAYKNSVIRDANTTDICKTGMEGPFDKDDYVPPLYHHGCRTIGPKPIFEGERYEIHPFPHDKVAAGFDH